MYIRQFAPKKDAKCVYTNVGRNQKTHRKTDTIFLTFQNGRNHRQTKRNELAFLWVEEENTHLGVPVTNAKPPLGSI
jgi:hypothetical protein